MVSPIIAAHKVGPAGQTLKKRNPNTRGGQPRCKADWGLKARAPTVWQIRHIHYESLPALSLTSAVHRAVAKAANPTDGGYKKRESEERCRGTALV
jgi:hypothetical protein